MKAQTSTPAASAIPAAASESKHNADQPRTADTTGSPKPAAQPAVAPPKLVEEKVQLAEIVVDECLQCRAKIDEKVVEDYAAWMKEDVEFPAIVVYEIAGKIYLTDGFHRFAAAKLVGLEWLWADIRQGTRRDALAFSIKVNAKHGLRFTNADKRHAVELALKEFTTMSAGWVADLCRVSQPFVSKISRELKTVLSSTATTGKDGIKRKVAKPKLKPVSDQTAGAATSTDDPERDDGVAELAPGESESASSEATAGQDDETRASKADGNSNVTAPAKKAKAKAAADQLTETQVGTESAGKEQKSDQPARKPSEFDLDQTWKKIEVFLSDALAKCPSNKLKVLQDRIYTFADKIL